MPGRFPLPLVVTQELEVSQHGSGCALDQPRLSGDSRSSPHFGVSAPPPKGILLLHSAVQGQGAAPAPGNALPACVTTWGSS